MQHVYNRVGRDGNRFAGNGGELVRLRGKLLQSQADLGHAQEIAHLGIWAADVDTGIVETSSPETYRIFSICHDKQPIRIGDLNQRIHPDDLARVLQARDQALRTPGVRYDCQYRVLDAGGGTRYVHSLADVISDSAGVPIRIVGVTQDMTGMQLAQQQIARLAFIDEATGLPNRVAMHQHLDAAFCTGHSALPLAVLTIELADFRQINLALGHRHGDALLRGVAHRLASLLGDGAHLSRTANAQFTAVLHGAQAQHAQSIADAIARAFERTFQIAGVCYELSAHVGIASAVPADGDPAALVRMADVAVCRARRHGRSSMAYSPGDDPYDPKRLALLGEFRQAISAGEIELYCQPKVAMATGAVIGAEALVRWRHPVLGMVPPSVFVPLVESTELIHTLTAHMLEESVRQSHAWRQQGLALPIAVNLSARNLGIGGLAGKLQALLADWGGTPDWIGLEVTESSLIVNPDAAIAELNALSQLGFRLFIDDFGTGYASLNYLTMLPMNVIKIDHGFTGSMLEDTRSAAIVKATIDLAHDLGMGVVAEGTASRGIWDVLAECGCDEAQGFYVAAPMPAGEFAAWVRNGGFCHH